MFIESGLLPLLSIIVPVFNSERFLHQCLDSIKGQTFNDWECWLIDDGSTDMSGIICDQYCKADSRFKVIHKPNEGLVIARMTGVKACRGDYIGFVDSDDWIEPDMYAQLIDALEVEDEVDIAITNIIQECEGSSIMEQRKIPKYQMLSSEDALSHMVTRRVFAWELWCKVYRKELFCEDSFNCGLTVGEDFFTSWHVFNHARRVVCLPSKGYHYRLHPASMSHLSSSRQRFLESLAAVLCIEYKVKEPLQSYLLTWYMKELSLVLLEEELRKTIDDLQASKLHLELEKCVKKLDYTWFDASWRHLMHFLASPNGLTKLRDYIEDLYRHVCLISKGRNVVIYGAGGGGRLLADILAAWNMDWMGFVVSDGHEVLHKFCGKPVWKISQLSCIDKTFFMLGLSSRYVGEVRSQLRLLGARNIYWPLCMRFLTGQEPLIERCKDRLLKDVSPLKMLF